MRTLASERDRDEVVGRLRRLRPDSARLWGRMSAHQAVCHLADALRMASGEKRVSHATRLLQRTLLKWFVLYAPARWPAGVPTSPELDQDGEGTPPSEFAEDVAELEALLERLTGPERNRDRQPHPIFGPMSDAEWLRWGYLHMDHHLRQFGL